MDKITQESAPDFLEPVDVRTSLLTPGLSLSRRASLRPRSISPPPPNPDNEQDSVEIKVIVRKAPQWSYGTMTNEELAKVKEQIGIIDVSFPEVKNPKFEDFTDFPQSYWSLSSKEKLILMFAENFRQQYSERYRDRMPLVLAPKNECGIQKFASTTIRPTSLHYPDFIGSWERISSFVADHIDFEPLTEPTIIPGSDSEDPGAARLG
ncbi:coiled-coil domain-containing protein lobo [Sergentomyia squamirostris]